MTNKEGCHEKSYNFFNNPNFNVWMRNNWQKYKFRMLEMYCKGAGKF